MADADFLFWGVFWILGAITVGYWLWMKWHERNH